MNRRLLPLILAASALWSARSIVAQMAPITPAAAPASPAVKPTSRSIDGDLIGEQIPSEDSVLVDFHSLGLVDGRVDIFRCSSPVRDLAKKLTAGTQPSPELLAEATARAKRLYDLGIRTEISLEDPKEKSENGGTVDAGLSPAFVLDKAAAEAAGLKFVSHPIRNSGKDSLQDMTDAQVLALIDPIAQEILDDAKTGGVMFHCSAGHDRTGIVAAYIRMKFEHWSVDAAIAEMRRLGHNWPKFSADGGHTSWHEAHLRAIAKMIEQPAAEPAAAAAQ